MEVGQSKRHRGRAEKQDRPPAPLPPLPPQTCTFYVIGLTVLVNGGSVGYMLEHWDLKKKPALPATSELAAAPWAQEAGPKPDGALTAGHANGHADGHADAAAAVGCAAHGGSTASGCAPRERSALIVAVRDDDGGGGSGGGSGGAEAEGVAFARSSNGVRVRRASRGLSTTTPPALARTSSLSRTSGRWLGSLAQHGETSVARGPERSRRTRKPCARRPPGGSRSTARALASKSAAPVKRTRSGLQRVREFTR